MLTIYDWMLLNGQRLAEAIKEDGCVGGVKSDPLLEECQKMDAPRGSRRSAKRLLRMFLRNIGAGHISVGGESDD